MDKQSDKARILGMIHKERDALDALVAPLSTAQLLDPTLPGGRSIKDTLLHIAAWERRFLGWMAEAARGATPALPAPDVTWDDVDQLNEQTYQANRDVALPAAQAESRQAFGDFLAYIEAASSADLVDPQLYPWLDGWALVPLIASNSYQHYREHADEVRAWLAARAAEGQGTDQAAVGAARGPAMQVVPVTLVGREVRLEPFRPEHAEALWQVAEPSFFHLFPVPPEHWTLEGFGAWLDAIAARPAWSAFTIILQATGQPIGLTCYLDIRPADRGLEIGSTWIAQAHQGTRVNPECKYLLFRHAFETLGAIRVQLKTDLRNVHSQRAIAKLGAVREGVLRKHVIMADGYFRDTVMFSVTDNEWPAVKAGLEARLGYAP